MYVILICVQVMAVASAQALNACPDSRGGDCGEEKHCLLHTRTQMRSLDGITEGLESNYGSATYDMDYLGVLHKHHHKRYERESSQMLAQTTSRAAQRSAWVSYQGSLGTVLTSLEHSRQTATGQLEDTINEFIEKQAGSEDACHAQLLEAKHQLNQLHLHVDDLSRQVNATDHEITALNAQVESKLEENEQLEEECKQKLEENEKKNEDDLKFLTTLRNELDEMIQIANPDVTMNQTAGKVFAGGKGLESLLGVPAEAFLPFLAKIKIPSVQTLMQTGITSASFIQVDVANDGSPTQVRYKREELAPLKLAFKHVAKCMSGHEKYSLLNTQQSPTGEPVEISISEAPTGEPLEAQIVIGDSSTAEPTVTPEIVIGASKPTGKPIEVDLTKDSSKESKGFNPYAAEDDAGSSEATSGEDSPTMPPAKDVVCGMDDTAKVEVGGVAGELSPPRGLAQGEYAQIPCSRVNKEYFGAIWLTCDKELTASATQCLKAANGTKCQEELEILQKVYIKTYVDLARLIQQYEEQTTEGYEANKQAIEDQCRDRRDPIQNDASNLAQQVSEKVKTLEELRPKLEDALEAYHKLREQVEKLSGQCKALPETITDLDKVRDAIKALSLCPGLDKARLIVPKWTGRFVDFDEPSAKLSDDDFDAMMLQACIKSFGGEYPDKVIRAASVAEIAAGAVLELPTNYTGETPLIGPCPGCEGKEDDTTTSGHLRACWKPGAELTNKDRYLNCNEGLKSIACVIDGDK